ncbi:MAG: hypothetical protein FJ316_08705 [SAR202 cluster bacterium]|nr:hypothetical protein [SAR202 cluster bacterium]
MRLTAVLNWKAGIVGLAFLTLAALVPGRVLAGSAADAIPLPAAASKNITARSVTVGNNQTGPSDPNSATAVTASVTIGANNLALLWLAQNDGTSGVPTLNDLQRTWEVVTTTEASLQRLTLYRSMQSTATTSVITITAPAPTPMSWTLVEYSNVDTSGSNGSGAIGQFEATNYKKAGVGLTTYASSVLTPAVKGTSTSVGGFAVHQDSVEIKAGKGYTLIGSRTCAIMCVQSEFKAKFARLVDLSWTNNAQWLVVTAEVKRKG